MPQTRAPLNALPVGRVLRLCLGIGLLVQVVPFFSQADSGRIGQAVMVVLGLTVVYAVIHWAVSSFPTKLNPWFGAMLAILPVVSVFVSGGTLGEVGSVTFVGLSLLLAAVRADAGCEVMSLPGLIFGRRTHLCCLLFSPIDWLELRIVNAIRPSNAGGLR